MRPLVILLALQIPLGLDRGLLAPPENPVTPEKAALGRRLFNDPQLSTDNRLACSGCHQQKRAFTDGRRVAIGVGGQRGERNVPTLINRTYGRSFFWDGRGATLEEQVLRPIQHPKEMAAQLSVVVARLRANAPYQRAFTEVFGGPPDARSLSHALATYVRTILAGASPYDDYEAGDQTALSTLAQHGLHLFRNRARCSRCHAGSNLTDEAFHNTGIAWRDGRLLDQGRYLVTRRDTDRGAFKTPTLREVERTAPYMHDGSLSTLEEVVAFYDEGGRENPYRDRELRPLSLTEHEKTALVSFLRSLTGEVSEGLPLSVPRSVR